MRSVDSLVDKAISLPHSFLDESERTLYRLLSSRKLRKVDFSHFVITLITKKLNLSSSSFSSVRS